MSIFNKIFNYNINTKKLDQIESDIKESKKLTRELRQITEKYINSQKELESEKIKFKLLFEQSILIKAFLHLDGTIQKVNKKFEEAFGYKQEEIVGKNICEFVFDEDYDDAVAIPKKFLSNDFSPIKKRLKYKKKDGTPLYTNAIIYPIIIDNNNVFVVGIAEDITYMTKLEKILDDKRNFIKNIVDVVPGVIYVYNIQEQRNVWANTEVAQYLGYTKREIKNMGSNMLKRVLTEDDFNEYIKKILPTYNTLSDNDVFEHTHQFIHKNGDKIWFNVRESVFSRDEDNNVKEILGIMIDITNLKKQEEQLKLNYEALKNANDSIIITDKDANIIFVNDTFCKITGYSVEEVLGKNPRILQSGEHSDQFYLDMWETLTTGNSWVGKLINKTKDGKLFTEQTTITPVANGEIKYYVAIKVLVKE